MPYADTIKRKQKAREWYVNNRERLRLQAKDKYHARKHQEDKQKRYADSARRNRLKRTGFTDELFQQAVAMQDGKCGICEREMTMPHADHCHATGVPRGVLCRPCNMALGLFKDSVGRLRRAVEYLLVPPLHGVKVARAELFNFTPRRGQLSLCLTS